MKKGTKVSWKLLDGVTTGTGTVITDEVDGHVQVASETKTVNGTTTAFEVHNVIWCTVTWLTPINPIAAVAEAIGEIAGGKPFAPH